MSALTDVFTAIANAIRAKKGVSTTYKPSEMASAISSIPQPTVETLWSNPNTSADFATQTITISKMIPLNSYLKITYKTFSSGSDTGNHVFYDLISTGSSAYGSGWTPMTRVFGEAGNQVYFRYIRFRPGDTRSEGREVIISSCYHIDIASITTGNLIATTNEQIPIKLELVTNL